MSVSKDDLIQVLKDQLKKALRMAEELRADVQSANFAEAKITAKHADAVKERDALRVKVLEQAERILELKESVRALAYTQRHVVAELQAWHLSGEDESLSPEEYATRMLEAVAILHEELVGA